MYLWQIVSGIELVAQKLELSHDSRFQQITPLIKDLVHQYRAGGIMDLYQKTRGVDYQWFQDFGTLIPTAVNSADDPSVQCTSTPLWKINIPTIVQFGNENDNERAISIFTAAKNKQIYPLPFARMIALVPNSTATMFPSYARIEDAIYLNKFSLINMQAVIDDPTQGYRLLTTYVTTLDIGVSYTVVEGQIVHNGIPYYEGNSFVAVNTFFTGLGKVMHTNKKRLFSWDKDPYPMSKVLLEYIIVKIFTNELGIQNKMLSDMVNDSIDEALKKQK